MHYREYGRRFSRWDYFFVTRIQKVSMNDVHRVLGAYGRVSKR